MPPSAVLAGGGRKATLTRELVIEKIQRWNALFGEPPLTADWNPSVARWRAQEWRIERYRAGDPATGEPWPSLNAAKRHFDGSFDAAVRAAGLVPHRPGPRRRVAGSALPEVEQRVPQAPRDVEAALLAASERVLEAERRALRAEDRARRADARAESAAAKGAGSRARLREAEHDAATRARDAERAATDEVRRIARAAEEAVRAAEARAEAAERARDVAEAAAVPVPVPVPVSRPRPVDDGLAARRELRRVAADRDAAAARAEAAERRVRELETTITGGRRLTPAELAELRAGGGPVGPGPLAAALKELAAARASTDRVQLHAALSHVAGAAVRWRERL